MNGQRWTQAQDLTFMIESEHTSDDAGLCSDNMLGGASFLWSIIRDNLGDVQAEFFISGGSKPTDNCVRLVNRDMVLVSSNTQALLVKPV